jgi:hypothetical protein
MNKNTIEILLLFGIVFVSLGIIVIVGRQYAAHLEREGFQGVARGGAAPMYRGDYNRPIYDKERYTRETYTQERYSQEVRNITNSQIRYIRIEGGSDHLTLSYIAVYTNTGEELSTKSTVSSSGEHQYCRDDWKFGRRWNVTGWAWRDGWVPTWGCDTAGMWYVKDGDIRNKDYYTIYHSSGGNAWLEMTLDQAYWLDRVVVYNRKDADTHRLAGYTIKFYDNNKRFIFEQRLNANQQQTITMPAYTCAAGFRQIGGARGTRCEQNCAAGEDADNGALMCYKPCKSGMNLEGGRGGTCRRPCNAGFTLGASDVCFKDCVAPDIDAGGNRCYRPCAAGEDASRPPKCYRVCPGTHRLIEDQCFPNDPYTYLPIAWFGPVVSLAETTRNMGLTLSLGGHKGAAVGLWGSISETASSTNYATDQLWAYTENMELVNMHNRRCLDTSTGATKGGENPTTWDCHGGENQKWFVDSEGRIRSKQVPTLCLTAGDPNSPSVPLPLNSRLTLQTCTNDGNKFQRWRIPGARAGLNQAVAPAAAPPALPAEPLNRDGFTDAGSGSSSSKRLLERTTDDAF